MVDRFLSINTETAENAALFPFQPVDVSHAADKYPKVDEIRRLGSDTIPTLNDPRKKETPFWHAPARAEITALAKKDMEVLTDKSRSADPATARAAGVPKWGYNLSRIIIVVLYLPSDERIHNQSMGHIRKGKEHYAKLDDITRTIRIVRTLNKDQPASIDFSKHDKAPELLKKMAEYGLVEKDKLEKDKMVFSNKEVEVLLTNLETESKIIPNKAQVEFSFVPVLGERQVQTTRIVTKTIEIENNLIQRSLDRSKGG